MDKKVAYTSDLHLDFYFDEGANIRRSLEHNFTSYFNGLDSDVLVIAGDITHHSPEYTTEVLLDLKDWLGLKYVVTVNGNHDGYLTTPEIKNRFSDGLQLSSYRTDLLNLNGVHALEGNHVEIDGIKIGGADSFYDGSIYFREAGPYAESIEQYWKRYMNDSKHMRLDSFLYHAGRQKELLYDALMEDVDVMISHMNPCVDPKAFHKDYHGDISNAFYSFDFGDTIANNGKLQHWLYGHTHTSHSYSIGNTQVSCNPFGYPSETRGRDKRVAHIVVIK